MLCRSAAPGLEERGSQLPDDLAAQHDLAGAVGQDPDAVELERDEHRRIVRDEHGRAFTYDVAGRLESATVDGRTTTYGYDDLDRVTGAVVSFLEQRRVA